MSWTKVLQNNALAMQDFINVQKTCSDFYNEDMTLAKATQKIVSINGCQAYTWRDANYQLNLCTSLDNLNTIRLRVVGAGLMADIPTAASMILDQIILVMKAYPVKDLYAIWGDDVTANVQSFYQEMAKGFAGKGFIKVVLIQPRAHVFTLTASLP